jgi:translation initiation factor 2D
MGPPFPERAVKGAVVAVASLEKPTVPLFVGVCEIDVAGLAKVQGAKGHAVKGVQWDGDEIWAWSSSARPGQPSPEFLEGGDDEVDGIEGGVDGLDLEDMTKNDKGGEEGGVSLGGAGEDEPDSLPEAALKEPTTKGKLHFSNHIY